MASVQIQALTHGQAVSSDSTVCGFQDINIWLLLDGTCFVISY